MKFAATVRVMNILIDQLQNRQVSTMRDIYYKDVTLFKGRQAHSNNVLDAIANSLNVSLQSDLGVYPTPKGVIWSNNPIEITMGEQKKMSFDPCNEPLLICHRETSETLSVVGDVDMVVVFEKEAILKSFMCFVKKIATGVKLILATGKGFPDRATLSFLGGLQACLPSTPMVYFVDSDVYGLQIFWSYMQMSELLAQNAKLGGAFICDDRTEWLTMDKREWIRSVNFLQRNARTECDPSVLVPVEQHLQLMGRELRRSLLLFKKAEINVIKDDEASFQSVNQYLWSKITLYVPGTGDLT
ncbi:putative meiotic recombination protein [Clavispora lusitaniae]|uniref:Meiotic recombination protein n=1 Tax=Clavispora lusitaniae TaxID=36911 RepID=A0ACD0WDA1_CLALS|nr:putative meiotic recombination protein [Clavispora lusitaniae]QFZ31272.1 putative meiotic recombination protein [Clavispora lusitaniae]QFZ36940.1 putative meiotic recombination protein [Clavispora lusitaniae]QFZ42624.1 putative meiotic recombination protein [Clavispora lusitaniae]QFZ48300.1 putative meiotic recombination protein [Clavispora lusitaniae]